MTFIGDYRPTKRVGIEELDGCTRLLAQAVEDMDEAGVAGVDWYRGALLALSIMRDGRFEYPHEFVAVFERKLEEMEGAV